MDKDQVMKDILCVAKKKELTSELKNLKKVLSEYSKAKDITDSRTRTDLVLLVAGLLDWSEEEFEDVITRFSRIQIRKETGLSIDQIISLISTKTSQTVH